MDKFRLSILRRRTLNSQPCLIFFLIYIRQSQFVFPPFPFPSLTSNDGGKTMKGKMKRIEDKSKTLATELLTWGMISQQNYFSCINAGPPLC